MFNTIKSAAMKTAAVVVFFFVNVWPIDENGSWDMRPFEERE